MISKRNYFIISLLMLAILFLFQFSQLLKETKKDYSINPYSDTIIVSNRSWQQSDFNRHSEGIAPWEDGDYILYIGSDSSAEESIVSQWALYSKRDFLVLNSVSQYSDSKYKKPEMLIISPEYVNFDKDLPFLQDMVADNVIVVFASMPDTELLMNNRELRVFCGIDSVREKEITVEGIKLFSGYLLGGETIYEPKKKSEERRQDMNLSMPWFVTAGGTKTYMVGILDDYFGDYKYKNDFFPAVIWRNSFKNGQVFCVCGDYMSTTTGLGILSGFSYEAHAYDIYPVVNAQNTLLLNFPLMSNENEEQFLEIYSRDAKAFQEEVIWPTLISLAERYDLKYSCLISPKFNYTDSAAPSMETYYSYLKEFGDREAEIGMSLEHDPSVTVLEKVDRDKEFYDGLEQKYLCLNAFMSVDEIDSIDELVTKSYVKDVRTIACKENVFVPVFDYVTDTITRQSLTSNTKNLTYSKDLQLKGVETALGFDNAEMNFADVIWPQSEEDHWENIYADMSSALTTYWKPFRAFDRTTLTESDERVRVFLNLDFEDSYENDTVTLKVEGKGKNQAWFILRTHGDEIKAMQGGSFKEIENNAYLLTIDENLVTIELKKTAKVD